MKRMLMASVGLGLMLSVFAASAAVKCESLNNTKWYAEDLGKIEDVYFSISSNPTSGSTVKFEWDDGHGDAELSVLQGSCVDNPDGTATITLSRDSYGITGNITATTSASAPNELNVTSFGYKDSVNQFSYSDEKGTVFKKVK